MPGYVYGASGFGNEVRAVTERALAARRVLGPEIDGELIGFLDDDLTRRGRHFELPVRSLDEALDAHGPALWVVLAIGKPQARASVAARLSQRGVSLPTLIDPDATVLAPEGLGVGCLVMPGAFLSTQVRVGDRGLIAPRASISHDTDLGADATINPGALIAGHCTLGARVYLGIGATVKDRIRIGDDAIVGAGAVVIRDVPAATTVVGVPAHPTGGRVQRGG